MLREEIGVQVWMADPTSRARCCCRWPAVCCSGFGEQPFVHSLEKLEQRVRLLQANGGQPVHDVGEDVHTLGLPGRRPDGRVAFRMLCRHNRYVQEFGRVRDPREIARREALWESVIDDIEYETGQVAATLTPAEFRRHLEARVDLDGFHGRARRQGAT